MSSPMKKSLNQLIQEKKEKLEHQKARQRAIKGLMAQSAFCRLNGISGAWKPVEHEDDISLFRPGIQVRVEGPSFIIWQNDVT